MEERALSRDAFDPDVSLMHLNDLFDDRQAQASALNVACRFCIDVMIGHKNVLDDSVSDADAVILYAQVNKCALYARCDDNVSSLGRIFDRIGEQIGDYLD